MTLSLIAGIVVLIVIYADCQIKAPYAECRYAECRCAECCYAECRYSECRYAECRYAYCHGALYSGKLLPYLLVLEIAKGKRCSLFCTRITNKLISGV
jgi:hypothetical protein